MNLILHRLFDNGDDSIGILLFKDVLGNPYYVHSLEDEYQSKKVYGETRIPAGSYSIKMRKEGRVYTKYLSQRDNDIRNFTEKWGVLELQKVPGFKHILIHIGNNDNDTAGCILIGDSVNNNSYDSGFIANSTVAYCRLIREVDKALDREEELTISIYDTDKKMLGDL